MASAKLYFDGRTAKKDGTHSLRIIVSHKNKTFIISLSVSLTKEQWDETLKQVVLHPQRKMLNTYAAKMLADVKASLYELEMSGRLRNMSIKDVRDYVNARLGREEEKAADEHPKDLFLPAFTRYMEGMGKESTKGVYRYTLNKLSEYTDLTTLRISDITKGWLREFDAWMSRTCRTNTRSIHMRNIRAVFNDAIDNEVTDCYPFRRFKIRSEATQKRSLSAQDLRTLRDYPCEEHQRPYRDMFMLSFYLMGINAVDLFGLTADNVQEGRVVYRRSKTGRLYSIKIEPEAAELLERYKGKKHLLYVLDEYKNYKDYVHRMNLNLQSIGETVRKGRGGKKHRNAIFPTLTSYWARHTWATLASGVDVPKDVIGHALGHSWATSTTTDIYIDFDMKKVDEANRRVLDYIR